MERDDDYMLSLDLQVLEAKIQNYEHLLSKMRGLRTRLKKTRARRNPLTPLSRIKGEQREEFYERVAEEYRRTLLRTRYPVTEMAKLAGVPPRTVHAWVRLARELGKLPPGRQGKAG